MSSWLRSTWSSAEMSRSWTAVDMEGPPSIHTRYGRSNTFGTGQRSQYLAIAVNRSGCVQEHVDGDCSCGGRQLGRRHTHAHGEVVGVYEQLDDTGRKICVEVHERVRQCNILRTA